MNMSIFKTLRETCKYKLCRTLRAILSATPHTNLNQKIQPLLRLGHERPNSIPPPPER